MTDLRSTYPRDYVPSVPGGWIRLAANEPNLEGARLIVAERLGLPPHSHNAWLALPTAREWKCAEVWEKLRFLQEWIVTEIGAMQERSQSLVEYPNISTLGD